MKCFFEKCLRARSPAKCRASIAAGIGCWALACSFAWSPALAQDPISNQPAQPKAGQILFELPSPDSADRPEDDAGVRSAVYHDSIPELPDVVAHQSGVVESLKQNATRSVNGIMASIPATREVGSKLQQTLSSVNIQKVFGSLSIVLGAYFGFVWLMRRVNGGRVGGLPREVVEVLGHAPFGPKKNLQLVRLGSKLLLLIHSPEGTTTIGEINDSKEVEYLTGVCTGKAAGNRPPTPAVAETSAPTEPSPQSSYPPEVTIPARELEKMVRKLASATGKSGGNLFEA